MNATIFPEKKKHYPVLLNEIISIITPQYGGTFIDCTFGQGGYTKRILEYPKTKVIALDRDPESIKISSTLEKKFGKRFSFKNKKFSFLEKLELDNENINSIIFDLGYSYTQIKDVNKGLSFNSHGDLNMKMGQNEFSAKDVINNFVDNMLSRDSLHFRGELLKIAPDIELQQEVELGDETVEVDIPMTVEFFWPKAGT